MSDPVRAIADACLYEGYILWPYRRSALKNQRRWTFGGVYPEAHAQEHPDDRCLMRTQCLLEGAEPGGGRWPRRVPSPPPSERTGRGSPPGRACRRR